MYKSYNSFKKPNFSQRPHFVKPYSRPTARYVSGKGSTEGYKINEMINYPEVRIIKDGENLGLMSSSEALKMAKENEMDLVLVAEKAVPPICKIIDFSKFKYQEAQKKQKAKANSKQQDLKEFRIRVSTGEHDTETKIRRAKEFLKRKDKVKFTLKFMGREIEYKNLGYDKLKKVEELLQNEGKVVESPKLMGNMLMITFDPK